MGIGSLFKGIGPYISAMLFSATAESGLPFPLDYHFVFYMIGILLLV